jgi:hypothetical protein
MDAYEARRVNLAWLLSKFGDNQTTFANRMRSNLRALGKNENDAVSQSIISKLKSGETTFSSLHATKIEHAIGLPQGMLQSPTLKEDWLHLEPLILLPAEVRRRIIDILTEQHNLLLARENRNNKSVSATITLRHLLQSKDKT